MQKVKTEVAEFMKYLQDVAKMCANDYNFLPMGATRYVEVRRYSSEPYEFCMPLSSGSSPCLCVASRGHLNKLYTFDFARRVNRSIFNIAWTT